jgi:hypothetical protein
MTMNANTLVSECGEGQKLTSSELEQARLYLQQTRSYMVGATIGLSEAQWNYKPAPNCWSISEILEHVVAVQEFVMGPIRAELAQAPASAAHPDYKRVDGIVIHMLPVRLNKFKGPEALRPSGQWAPAEATARLLRNNERLIEYIESAPDLRQHMRQSPPLKAVSNGEFEFMDGYQWALAAGAHTERHAKQILEIKADPNFPAR